MFADLPKLESVHQDVVIARQLTHSKAVVGFRYSTWVKVVQLQVDEVLWRLCRATVRR